jgi:hypothetical protein
MGSGITELTFTIFLLLTSGEGNVSYGLKIHFWGKGVEWAGSEGKKGVILFSGYILQNNLIRLSCAGLR